MAPSRATAALLFSAAVFVLLSGARSQQPYGTQIGDCHNKHNDTGMLGYFCNGAPSCQSYLTFRARPPYSDPASIAALLGANATNLAAANSASPSSSSSFAPGTKVLVPVPCACTGRGRGHYQSNVTSYVAVPGDTLLIIAKGTFQGLTTCQAVQEQSLGGKPPESLLAGQRLPVVPLRCACPSAAQAAAGTRFLVSYLVDEFDEVRAVAARFGVDAAGIAAANGLKSDGTIFPFTTLLIPVKSPPDISQLRSPPPPPPPPPAASVPAAEKRSNHAGVYIGVGVAVAAVAVIASVGAVLARKARKRARAGAAVATTGKGTGKASHGTTSAGEVSVTISEAFSSLSDIKSSLKVYTYEELTAATDDFSAARRIGGSVYRATFGADTAAVEVVAGRDASKEVELMSRMNHFNLVRLTGVCHHRGRWYLVSEYAAHGTLRDRLLLGATEAPAALSWAQRVQVALDAAEGLRYLHEYARPPCVHMDVRSGSVLLDAALRGKVCNFGCARAIRGGAGEAGPPREFTMTSSIGGARGYVAPEYLEHGVVSPKADVYSLGVVLLELVTGKGVDELDGSRGDPLAGLNALTTGDREEEGDGAALEKLEEFVDPAMAAGSCPRDAVVMMVRLIERCLRRDAAARPSMGEVAQYLLKLSGISGDSWRSSSEYLRSSGSETASQRLAR
ncbi:lysM domain receptor-like kinase 4 [Brachypodium distachyon]|uniref:Protein kinase domain-containing protein n=1 Tax=Brachypodium distachyon TaxID=15368 RepID=I1IL35_BRADI|nr:lysM domain receptor-like kinase 4 [Brachypodium distachyon]KQJ88204.1 hypothetical protein BRADI_4g16350v3 [Brachypodium distachyon]|eukprot:XP_003575961.1 lysM domain receptor-like kinase 4 [Brachypodium distachyon]